ncbi:hypothetical protein NL676_009263 [Syzygium grande]|nr:hypothetical protein NL676_009263 [Syzygium grande]
MGDIQFEVHVPPYHDDSGKRHKMVVATVVVAATILVVGLYFVWRSCRRTPAAAPAEALATAPAPAVVHEDVELTRLMSS